MKERPATHRESQTPDPADVTTLAASIAEVQSASTVTPAETEITAPGTRTSPDYMDSSKYVVDMRGPGGFIDMRALPAQEPAKQRHDTPPPPLADPECLRDMRGPEGMVDMRSYRYRRMAARILRDQTAPEA
jgi:hypothetical protein